ncbi:MAG: bile acid:sodium symporter family protein, partial [Planctomycetia bacterium]
MRSFIDRINSLYVVWLLALSAVAFWEPRSMLWFDQRWIFWSLAASMLGMGLSLSLDDFRSVARMSGCVALGFGLQYTVMPLGGWLIATLLGLDADLKVGLVLVASCPGGMASNMISYLAQADVALSVVLTLCSTMLAFIFTPLWTTLLAGRLVPVDAWGLCLSALQLTVAPVAVGVLLRWLLPRTADRLGACGPRSAMLAFVLVTGGIGAGRAEAIAAHFGRLMLAAFG